MTLGKRTIDSSVRYILESEQTREIKQNTVKNQKQSEHIQPISGRGEPNTRRQKKLFHKTIKSSLKT